MKREKSNLLRSLPSVDQLLNHPEITSLHTPRLLVKECIKETLDRLRKGVFTETQVAVFTEPYVVNQVLRAVKNLDLLRIQRVVNATGVAIHTNLGRSPLKSEHLRTATENATTYCTLEYDLRLGKRSHRGLYLRKILSLYLGAGDALVVNNNAAAVLLSIDSLAHGREVIVSRGEMVEIGGSFRVPDVVAKSGATMVEVGCTNKTKLTDYEKGYNDQTALILKTHLSNFSVHGFVEETPLAELAEFCHQKGTHLLVDLGTGYLGTPEVKVSANPIHNWDGDSSTSFSHRIGPPVQECLEKGADLVCVSGDKLFGGPQAGIILGKKDLIAKLAKNPLYRAFRCDKLILATLQETVLDYIRGEESTLPLFQILSRTAEQLRQWCEAFMAMAEGLPFEFTLCRDVSMIGGGAGTHSLPTWLLGVSAKNMTATRLENAFREHKPPIIGRVKDDRFYLDPRTILTGEKSIILDCLKRIAKGMTNHET